MDKLRFAALILICLMPFCVYSQVNKRLKEELDSIYHVDQLYRDILDSPQKKDSLAKTHNLAGQEVDQRIFSKMTEIDRSNIKRVKRIIKQYGYPGAKLVGSPTNEAAWYVIQHSEDIAQYFPLIERAGKGKELPFDLVAMMQDRLLMGQGKQQLYGTQVRCENSECYVWPIANPAQVNQRRKQAGFKSTVEQNAKRLGVEYKVRTLPKK